MLDVQEPAAMLERPMPTPHHPAESTASPTGTVFCSYCLKQKPFFLQVLLPQELSLSCMLRLIQPCTSVCHCREVPFLHGTAVSHFFPAPTPALAVGMGEPWQPFQLEASR